MNEQKLRLRRSVEILFQAVLVPASPLIYTILKSNPRRHTDFRKNTKTLHTTSDCSALVTNSNSLNRKREMSQIISLKPSKLFWYILQPFVSVSIACYNCCSDSITILTLSCLKMVFPNWNILEQ